MRLTIIWVAVCVMMFTTTSYAQNSKDTYKVSLKSGVLTPEKALADLTATSKELNDVKFQNEYYVILQFKSIPNHHQQSMLSNSGIRLISYLGGYAYAATVSKDINQQQLDATDLRAWAVMPVENKVATSLQQSDLPEWASRPANQIDLTLILHENNSTAVRTQIKNTNCEILGNALNNPRHLEIRTSVDNISTLAALPFVAYVEPIKAPDAKLNHYGVPAMSVRPVTAAFPGNQHYTGKGVTIGIGDGGLIETHVDFENRVSNETTLDIWGAHTYHVAGIAAGTGNINPWHKGVAHRSSLIMDITSNIIAKAPNLHTEGMMVTNNSYGPSNFNCSSAGDYNSVSQSVDMQMLEMPHLMHIIAGGNSGTTTCDGYPQSFRTILKSYSSNKNALTVGAASHRGRSSTFGSRGPLADGRLGPHISAPGVSIRSAGNANDYVMISGSSMAAPGVAGVWSLMVEAYRTQFNAEPSAALLKAYLLNTASDIGNPGPDYTFGYGMPNAMSAIRAIKDERFFQQNIENGQSQEYTIEVPANAAEVRVMLYWHDKEGTIGSAKALVNDLQLEVIAPNFAKYDPWILDHTPANVDNNATRGTDDLNNVEQVTLSSNNPGELFPGTYNIKVTGKQVPEGVQEYFVVYEIITNGVELVYPFGGETFMPGAREFFRWKAAGPGKNNVEIHYSLNDGITWKPIQTNPDHVEEGYVDFTFPESIQHTNLGRVKISINGGTTSDVNEYPFTIMQQPTLATPKSCGGKIYLDWDDIEGAVSYEIMRLDTIMKPLAVTNATTYIIDNLPAGDKEWYSVRPVSSTGHRGYRAIAKEGIVENTACSEIDDVRVKRIINPATKVGREFSGSSHSANQLITLELENKGNTPASNFDVSFALNGLTLVTDRFTGTIQPGELAEFTFGFGKDFSAPGIHTLTAKTSLESDANTDNDMTPTPIVLNQLANPPIAAPIDINENFDDLMPDIIQKNKMGIGDKYFLDFKSSNPNGELAIGSEFTNVGTALTLNNVADGIEAINELILTKNLSNYSIRGATGKIPLETLFLTFQYKNHEQESNPNNRVFVRGHENEEWLSIYNLDNNHALGAGAFAQTNSLDLIAMLRDAGQELSATFQIKFSQSGTSSANDPLNSDGLTFDNIQLKEGIELPVEMAYFEAKKAPNKRDAVISWRTLSETNNDYYALEVATENSDGQITVFREIHRTPGAGTTTIPQDYEYIDAEPEKSTTRYYRLKQVDISSAYTYSDIKPVDFGNGESDVINVYPVPFNEHVHVTVKSEPGTSLKIRVSDMAGRLIQEQQTELQTAGTHQERVNINKNIPRGAYLMQVEMGQYTHSKKIIKQE